MNTLTDARRRVEDALFVTLDTRTARWDLGDRQAVLLSDTVGFVRDLPHRLVASFRATLEEAIHADLLLHVVDATSPTADLQIQAVEAVLAELGCDGHSTITLFNKMDAVQDLSVVQVLENRIDRSVRLSARTGEGIGDLVAAVKGVMNTLAVAVTLRIPLADGKLIATIDQIADVRDRRYEGQHAEIDLSIDRRRLQQIKGRNPGVEIIRSNGSDSGDPRTKDG